METYTGVRDMKAYEFLMDDGERYTVLATSFARACEVFDSMDLDPREILSMREYTPQVAEAV